MKLTTATVSKVRLPTGKTDHIEWDDNIPGLGLRLREGGSRSFVFQYKLGATLTRCRCPALPWRSLPNNRSVRGATWFSALLTAHFLDGSRCRRRLDERITAANGGKPIERWRPHDLRRTFATYAGGGLPEHQLKKLPKAERELAAGLGIEPHVIEAVLNHVSGHKAGVAGIYNRATYPREKAAAMSLWADRLIAIVEDHKSTVTPLRRA